MAAVWQALEFPMHQTLGARQDGVASVVNKSDRCYEMRFGGSILLI